MSTTITVFKDLKNQPVLTLLNNVSNGIALNVPVNSVQPVGTTGSMYFNSISDTLFVNDGSVWFGIGTTGPTGQIGPTGSTGSTGQIGPTGSNNITNLQVISTTNTAVTNQLTLANIAGMTLTPTPAGTYLIMFSTIFLVSTNNRTVTFDLARNGTQITNTLNTYVIPTANIYYTVFIHANIVCNGTDIITARWATNANTTLTSPNYKRIFAMQLS